MLFRSSKDFYSQPSVGTRIKGPVELLVSTYRKLGVKEMPGVPDLHIVSRELGQTLLNPPTVAGWAQGRAWITPGLLLARGAGQEFFQDGDLRLVPLPHIPRRTEQTGDEEGETVHK